MHKRFAFHFELDLSFGDFHRRSDSRLDWLLDLHFGWFVCHTQRDALVDVRWELTLCVFLVEFGSVEVHLFDLFKEHFAGCVVEILRFGCECHALYLLAKEVRLTLEFDFSWALPVVHGKGFGLNGALIILFPNIPVITFEQLIIPPEILLANELLLMNQAHIDIVLHTVLGEFLHFEFLLFFGVILQQRLDKVSHILGCFCVV